MVCWGDEGPSHTQGGSDRRFRWRPHETIPFHYRMPREEAKKRDSSRFAAPDDRWGKTHLTHPPLGLETIPLVAGGINLLFRMRARGGG
ncbi:hypothetical protein NPIL_411191 [Nephila pilipes]|uniref:Uncharacterized protein n=1 Tax=Nephila pilipes TaxID=299642 RepID=A0A8X6MG58_NEPPI|nr:hypothetical protein NPIL_411191 [Nephila pilipes]